MNLQVYKAQIDPSLSSDLEVNFIGLVDRPAIEKNFQAFKENEAKFKFAIDEERRIISGWAMIADMLLYRNDNVLGEYNVMFDKGSIKTIVQKFTAKGYMQKFNLFHDDNLQMGGITIFNSFITDVQMGIRPPAGQDDIAEGSWYISAQVDNDAAWARVKSGEVKGFSVEGLFTYVPVKLVKMSEEEAVKKILQILNETITE